MPKGSAEGKPLCRESEGVPQKTLVSPPGWGEARPDRRPDGAPRQRAVQGGSPSAGSLRVSLRKLLFLPPGWGGARPDRRPDGVPRQRAVQRGSPSAGSPRVSLRKPLISPLGGDGPPDPLDIQKGRQLDDLRDTHLRAEASNLRPVRQTGRREDPGPDEAVDPGRLLEDGHRPAQPGRAHLAVRGPGSEDRDPGAGGRPVVSGPPIPPSSSPRWSRRSTCRRPSWTL